MTAPFGTPMTCNVQPQATAGNDLSTVAFVAPRAGTVTSVTYTTPTAITGAATNNRTVSLINKGTAGAATTTVATLNFASGVNTVAYDEKAITLSATPANLVVAAGDVLQWESLHILTGIADPGGLVSVTVSPNYS